MLHLKMKPWFLTESPENEALKCEISEKQTLHERLNAAITIQKCRKQNEASYRFAFLTNIK